MKMNPHRYLTAGLLSACLLLSGHTQADQPELRGDKVCVDEVCFPRQVKLAENPLPLSGAYEFKYWGFDVYTIAFYADDRVDTIREALSQDTPRKLVLVYHRSIDSEDIQKSTEKLVSENPDNDMEALRDRLDRTYELYHSVEEGDRYEVIYKPGEGTSFYFNGKLEGTIEGGDYAAAFFGVWLSEECIDDKMRDRLLGDGFNYEG